MPPPCFLKNQDENKVAKLHGSLLMDKVFLGLIFICSLSAWAKTGKVKVMPQEEVLFRYWQHGGELGSGSQQLTIRNDSGQLLGLVDKVGWVLTPKKNTEYKTKFQAVLTAGEAKEFLSSIDIHSLSDLAISPKSSHKLTDIEVEEWSLQHQGQLTEVKLTAPFPPATESFRRSVLKLIELVEDRRIVEVAIQELLSKKLDPNQFRSEVSRTNKNEFCVLFIDKEIPLDQSLRGNPSKKLPGLEVYLDSQTLEVLRSHYIR